METCIVRIEWTNSSDTYTGPFDTMAAAQQWADRNIEPLPISLIAAYWITLLSSPAFSADGWQLAKA